MKKANIFIGILLCILMTIPSYAQEIKKLKKMEMQQKEMQQIDRIPKIKKVPKRVNHQGYIDPITGQWVSTAPPLPIDENDISITSPSGARTVSGYFHISGKTKKNSRVKVEVKAKIEHDDEFDITQLYAVSDEDGNWKTETYSKPTLYGSSKKITFYITAVRINAERGNTAAVTVKHSPAPRPLPAAHSGGN